MASVDHVVEEDCVKYWLFPNLSASRDDLTRKHLLERYLEEYIANLGSYLINYIWQNEPFRLTIVHNDTEEMPAHLEGSTKFGDNIEDEWFIVFLLMQLTKEDEHLVVKIKDNDGEFLLIEAADYLPKWLNPDTSENRVYIYRQNINIISIPQSPIQASIATEKPKISDCIKAVVSTLCPTRANQEIQKAIKNRIKGYPEKISEFQHRAHCYIPAGVAAILKHDPSLISSAVQAFYHRDPVDLKACRVMKYFPPETRVMSEVTFTRCLYAQLIQQQYSPDRKVGWNIPSSKSPDFKSHDLGMKLACGFEILVANAKQSSKISSDLPEDIDLAGDNRWMRYLQTLRDKGYFRGELDGSILYQKLLKEAKHFYCENFVKMSSNDFHTPGAKILHLLETLSINYEEMKEEEKTLRPPDDDSWLEINPEELDKLLSEYSKKNECKRNSLSQKEEQLSEAITKSLKSFIYYKSDFEGAEIPNSKRSQKKESFDAEHFTDPMNSILDFHVPDSDHSSSSEMSGYSDEDDVDFSSENTNRKNTRELIEGMKKYMEQMDHELSNTDVGLSFERLPPKEILDGKEINQATNDEVPTVSDDEFHPVDVDLTVLKNILESYNSQQGLPGPASNLLSSMGVHLPDDKDTK